MNLQPAKHLAEIIKGILAPFCERIEIAGSIRRQRPQVSESEEAIFEALGLEFVAPERRER